MSCGSSTLSSWNWMSISPYSECSCFFTYHLTTIRPFWFLRNFEVQSQPPVFLGYDNNFQVCFNKTWALWSFLRVSELWISPYCWGLIQSTIIMGYWYFRYLILLDLIFVFISYKNHSVVFSINFYRTDSVHFSFC